MNKKTPKKTEVKKGLLIEQAICAGDYDWKTINIFSTPHLPGF